MTRRSWIWTNATATTIAAVVTAAAVVLSCAWSSGINRGCVDEQLDSLEQLGADHEQRIRSVEQMVSEIAVDVRYIRHAVDDKEGRP